MTKQDSPTTAVPIAPIEWLIDDLLTTLGDASPEELPSLHSKLEALVTSLESRKNEWYPPIYGNSRELEGREKASTGNTVCPSCDNHIEYCDLCGARLEPLE